MDRFSLLAPLPAIRHSIRNQDSGPGCYLCGRDFREGDRIVIVATGPGQNRSNFRRAASTGDEGDSVKVGAECARRFVPAEAVIAEERR